MWLHIAAVHVRRAYAIPDLTMIFRSRCAYSVAWVVEHRCAVRDGAVLSFSVVLRSNATPLLFVLLVL